MTHHDAPRAIRATMTRKPAEPSGSVEMIVSAPSDVSRRLVRRGPDKVAFLTAKPLAFGDRAAPGSPPTASFELSYPNHPDPINRSAHAPYDMPHLSHLAHLSHLDHEGAPRRAALLQAQDIAERIALIKEAHGLINRSGTSSHGVASGVAYPSKERLAAHYGYGQNWGGAGYSQSAVKRSAASFDMDMAWAEREDHSPPRRPAVKAKSVSPKSTSTLSKPKRSHSRAELSPPERFDTNIA